jgi:carboxypeptidase PM20D1
MRRVLRAIFALALVLVAAAGVLALVLVGNTLRQGSRQVEVPPLAKLAVDGGAVAQSLATALQARTVSGLTDPAGAARAFVQLHAHLAQRYPLVHAKLERTPIGEHGLLYTWRGSDAAAAPIAWLAHQDVVPIAPGTEALWKQPPFSGLIDAEHVHGRGALDNKANLIAQLEAVERALAEGFQPRRTLHLFFGHDEEVGGALGARALAERWRQQGVKLHYLLDEGMAVTEGILPGVAKPIALIGLGEKGAVTLKLVAQAAPGHSSLPPPGVAQSAIPRLARALVRLDERPLPGGIRGAAGEMFAAIAPELPFGQRLALSNLWLLRPVVEPMLSRAPATNALMRTTTAITVTNAGNQFNVLPGRAEALVNFRILPGETPESVLAFVKGAIADEGVEVTIVPGTAFPPTGLSATSAAPYRTLERTVREVFPDAIVAPGLVLQGTDARHFQAVAEQSYRFMPIRFRPEDLKRLHGTDERLPLAQLPDMVRFYHRLLVQSSP